jgi:hypothetical protein
MTSLAELNPDELDELEDEAPKRRPRPLVALPGEDIPAEVNEAFLEALAYERVLSLARALASPLALTAEARRAVWGHADTSKAAAGVLAEA